MLTYFGYGIEIVISRTADSVSAARDSAHMRKIEEEARIFSSLTQLAFPQYDAQTKVRVLNILSIALLMHHNISSIRLHCYLKRCLVCKSGETRVFS